MSLKIIKQIWKSEEKWSRNCLKLTPTPEIKFSILTPWKKYNPRSYLKKVLNPLIFSITKSRLSSKLSISLTLCSMFWKIVSISEKSTWSTRGSSKELRKPLKRFNKKLLMRRRKNKMTIKSYKWSNTTWKELNQILRFKLESSKVRSKSTIIPLFRSLMMHCWSAKLRLTKKMRIFWRRPDLKLMLSRR